MTDYFEWHTPDRHFHLTKTTITKRELRESEWIRNIKGKLVIPFRTSKYLLNERAALDFIAQNTTIPVPKVLHYSAENGIHSLTMERVPGVILDAINEEDKPQALENAKDFITQNVLPQLQQLKSGHIGGLVDHTIIPPERVRSRGERNSWPLKSSETAQWGFCHNDLAQHNIMMDETTLQVTAIIDWELSGYYPPEFEKPLWLKSAGEWANDREDKDQSNEETDRLIEFLLNPDLETVPSVSSRPKRERTRGCGLGPLLDKVMNFVGLGT